MATVERQQLTERVVVGNVGGPAIGGCDGRIERRVRVVEPLRPSVVEICQRALLQHLGGGVVLLLWSGQGSAPLMLYFNTNVGATL